MKQKYERFEESLQTSWQILNAIEIVTGDSFEMGPTIHKNGPDGIAPDHDSVLCNAAYGLWEDYAGKEMEIISNLPTECAEEGDELFWGFGEKFAEFDGEKWVRNEN